MPVDRGYRYGKYTRGGLTRNQNTRQIYAPPSQRRHDWRPHQRLHGHPDHHRLRNLRHSQQGWTHESHVLFRRVTTAVKRSQTNKPQQYLHTVNW